MVRDFNKVRKEFKKQKERAATKVQKWWKKQMQQQKERAGTFGARRARRSERGLSGHGAPGVSPEVQSCGSNLMNVNESN